VARIDSAEIVFFLDDVGEDPMGDVGLVRLRSLTLHIVAGDPVW
jgi:hypothetical protein